MSVEVNVDKRVPVESSEVVTDEKLETIEEALTLENQEELKKVNHLQEDQSQQIYSDSNYDLSPSREEKTLTHENQEELKKLNHLQDDKSQQIYSDSNYDLFPSREEKIQEDNRSIYIGNVDYAATAEEVEAHFVECGLINRVTIFVNKYTGQPKGFAYLEFTEIESVQIAVETLDKSIFKGREIKVNPKRTNLPGMSMTNRPPRARGYRGYSGYRGYRGYHGAPVSRFSYVQRTRGRSSYRPSPY